MPVWAKYILIQIPAGLLVAIALYMVWQWGWLSGFATGVILLLWVIKDAILYPIYRPALEGGRPSGPAALHGLEGTVLTDLAPKGLIQVRGERWKARSFDEHPIPTGSRVVVIDHRRLQLLVRPADAPESE